MGRSDQTQLLLSLPSRSWDLSLGTNLLEKLSIKQSDSLQFQPEDQSDCFSDKQSDEMSLLCHLRFLTSSLPLSFCQQQFPTPPPHIFHLQFTLFIIITSYISVIKPTSLSVRHSETCKQPVGLLVVIRQTCIRLNQIKTHSGDLCNIAASLGVIHSSTECVH